MDFSGKKSIVCSVMILSHFAAYHIFFNIATMYLYIIYVEFCVMKVGQLETIYFALQTFDEVRPRNFVTEET